MAKTPKAIGLVAVVALYSTTLGSGEIKPPGSIIELEPDEAQSGIARQLFADPENYQAAIVPASRPADSAAVIDEITARIRGWSDADFANEDYVTGSGKPIVAVLEKQLGYDITAEERDAAFAAVKASLV